jgi:hypothetical protein
MTTNTKARKALRLWMSRDASRTRGAVGRKLRVSTPAVSGWLDGSARPEITLRVALAKLTGGAVKVEDWLLAEEIAQMRDTRAFAEMPDPGPQAHAPRKAG